MFIHYFIIFIIYIIIIFITLKFINTTKGSKSLLQVAKTYGMHKTKRYMQCSQNKKEKKH